MIMSDKGINLFIDNDDIQCEWNSRSEQQNQQRKETLQTIENNLNPSFISSC